MVDVSPIHVKKAAEKINDFRKTPVWNLGGKIGARRLKEGKFKLENEAQKRDYMRAVNSNPLNQPGMPVFFPPTLLWATGIGEGQSCEVLPCGHPWRTKRYSPEGQCTVACKYGHEYPEGETR